ncbi:MAG: MoxR family ATPase [Acidobacteriota bacterium]
MDVDIKRITERVKEEGAFIDALLVEVRRVIVGQSTMLEKLLVGLLADGHVLLEGVPGLAKTTAVKALARAIDASFHRIQFTPDLLPADLIGTLIYNPRDAVFTPRKGPVFAHIVLADEINRAPAKVQSALLEAMQERQVTLGDETHILPSPFMVLATQNPIEQEGTYPLPEAQVDRFMLKLLVSYPSKKEERSLLDRTEGADPSQALAHVKPVIAPDHIQRSRAIAASIYVDDRVKDYIVALVGATRDPASYGLKIKDLLRYGASPRASLYLQAAARAHAFVSGRGYATPEDVKAIGPDVLRHRILLSYEAEAENVTPDDVVGKVFDAIEVP